MVPYFFVATQELLPPGSLDGVRPLIFSKMNGDGADLRLGTHAHIGPEQPDAGGDDIVHLPFFEISAGVLPHQPDGEIAREHLPVVRVAAEVEVNARVRKLLQFLRLVVEHDDGLTFVHLRRDLIGRFARLDAAAGTVRVGAAVEVKLSVDQRPLVAQERDVRVLQECVHARVALFLLALAEGKAREHRFFDIVVAVAGVNAVFRPDAAQRGGDSLRLIHRLPFVVEDIPRDDDKVGVLLVDPVHHLLHLLFADVVAEVQVSHEHDLHLTHALDGLVDRHVIRRHVDDARIDNAPDGRGQNDKRARAARDAVHLRRDKNVLERQHVPEQQAQKVRRDDREQHIQQHTEPVVADELHHTPEPTLRQEKCNNNRAGQKCLHGHRQRPVAHCAEKRKPRLHPAHHAAQQIEICQQVYRRKQNRDHVNAGASLPSLPFESKISGYHSTFSPPLQRIAAVDIPRPA